jgi:hypothetical protein
MKNLIIVLLLSLFCCSLSFSAPQRRIVFFAETSEIPQNVINKILASERFCLSAPINSTEGIPEKLAALVSFGKVEPSLSFNNEAILPLLANFSGSDLKQIVKQNIFQKYVSTALINFENHINKDAFGIFLNSGIISENVINYFENSRLIWINAGNIAANDEKNIHGVYDAKNIVIFAPYENFPFYQGEIMKWLETKKDSVIPVLLTKRHLQNYGFMEFLINLFDNSIYIKPATPLFVTSIERNLIERTKPQFKNFVLSSNITDKLYSAAKIIDGYSGSSDSAYANAQNELIYLCGWNLLKDISSGITSEKNMFNAAYSNIQRLLETSDKENKQTETYSKAMINIEKKDNAWSNAETSVNKISDGAAIRNNGILNTIRIVSKNNNITISLSFKNEQGWSENVDFIDFYIDMNNLEDSGSTSLLSGINGFLTPDSGWEYALRIYKQKAVLYKHSSDDNVIATIPVTDMSVSIPTKYIRGTPSNWGFQAIAVSKNNGKNSIEDFLNQNIKQKSEIILSKPFIISMVKMRR